MKKLDVNDSSLDHITLILLLARMNLLLQTAKL